MEIKESDWLAHSGRSKRDGAPVGSGRYPLGSGEDPYQDYTKFKNRVTQIKRQHPGIKEKDIVKYLYDDYGEMSIRDYRKNITSARAYIDAADYQTAHKLRYEKQWSYDAIAEEIGRSPRGVRDLLQRDATAKEKRINNTVEMLRESLDSKPGYIDVGSGSDLWAGVPKTQFDAAVNQLYAEGYPIITTSARQLFGQGNTTIKVLCPPGTTKAEVFNHFEDVRLPVDVKIDKKGDKIGLRPVENVDSKRIEINYAETGGKDKDGVIEIRRGVKDLDLGGAMYAQVRIAVDGSHFLKGMCVYADDLPDGVDIRFNTNKSKDVPKMEVLKTMPDPSNLTNPFGASIGSQRGALNIVNEEGSWAKWSKTLSAQFLAKQYPSTAKRQLEATAKIADAEFEEIKSLTNPTLKRYLLDEFASGCDSDAVHLKAVRLPGQTQKVLLPLPDNKPNECYCPGIPDGTEVALVRYPHGGVFEIPTVTVNNNNKTAEKIFGNAKDAIGIHPSKAAILSGADFDGDTVMVLPLTGSFKIKRSRPLPGLKDFDPHTQFDGSHLTQKDLMKKGSVQKQMGMITNLITDMTVQGADDKELARAVAHSMVVIDAYKHKLDYKASERYFGIKELREKYQPARPEEGHPNAGAASTLLSRAKSQVYVEERREKAVSRLTPEERERWEKGEIVYEPTNKKLWEKKTGEYTKPAKTKTNQMTEASDAYELSSGTLVESYYADYANHMKNLAMQARAEMRSTEKLKYSPSAKATYSEEVSSLNAKLKIALMNAPLERKAQTLANSTYRVEAQEHPEYTNEQLKKAKSRHLEAARNAVGAGKERISISDKEWEAIQAGAISDSKLMDILKNSNSDQVRKLAMPRGTKISSAKLARAKSLYAAGNTWADIAEILGVSVSTLQSELG